MAKFIITVPVECDTLEEAQQVAAERLGYDEDYGFKYQFGQDEVTEVPVPEERVVFRYFPHDGAVIALLPDQYNKRTGDIMSYMELGQHAETAPDFGDTKAADPTQYAALLAELRTIGYTNLKVVKRVTIRKNQL